MYNELLQISKKKAITLTLKRRQKLHRQFVKEEAQMYNKDVINTTKGVNKI